jgi:hypothetical protein
MAGHGFYGGLDGIARGSSESVRWRFALVFQMPKACLLPFPDLYLQHLSIEQLQ